MNRTYAGPVLLAALLWISPVHLCAETAVPQNSGSTAKQKSQTPPKHSTQKASAPTSSHRSTHHPVTGHVSSKATPPQHSTQKASAPTSSHRSTHHPATRHVSSKATPPKHPTQKASAPASSRPSTHHPATRHVSSKARRAAAARRRRAQLRPAPERIQEIQQALTQAGYLKEEPNGRWDDQTREAMRHYQADHGFPVTGLPEAKSLMKLGLGPHPLPADLDTSSGARAGTDTVSDTPTPPNAQQNPP